MTQQLFDRLFIVEMIYGILAFLSLFFIVAPYGRHYKKGWGPTMTARWAWIVQEFPVFFIVLLFFILNKGYENAVLTIFLLIWQVHYFHRTFIYPFRLTSPNKPYPIVLVIMAVAFNVINGSLNGFEIFQKNQYDLSWLISVPFVIGLLTFTLGYVINKQSDRILFAIKRNGSEYQIPTGGLYKYISCPNYLGEMMEWLGWAIMTWSIAGLGFFIFTVCNLFPRALSNHKWYKSHFKEYPKNRKALIPFLV